MPGAKSSNPAAVTDCKWNRAPPDRATPESGPHLPLGSCPEGHVPRMIVRGVELSGSGLRVTLAWAAFLGHCHAGCAFRNIFVPLRLTVRPGPIRKDTGMPG